MRKAICKVHKQEDKRIHNTCHYNTRTLLLNIDKTRSKKRKKNTNKQTNQTYYIYKWNETMNCL